MSRTRLEARKTIASVRNICGTDAVGNEGSIHPASVTTDRVRKCRSISGAYHTSEHITDEDYALRSSNYQNNNWAQESVFSQCLRSASEDLSAEGVDLSSNQSSQAFLTYPGEKASHSTLTLNKSSRSSAGWLLEASRWLFWKCIYHNICEVLLFDTWLLSRAQSFGKKKLVLLLLLLLLPLFLLGRFSDDSNPQLSINPTHLAKYTQKFSSFFSHHLSSLFYNVEEESEYKHAFEKNAITPESLWFDYWNVLPRKVLEDSKHSHSDSVQETVHVVTDETLSKEAIKSIAREVYKEESSQLMGHLEEKNRIKIFLERASELKSLSTEINTVHSHHQLLSDSLHNLKLEVNKKLETQNTERMLTDQLVTSKLHSLEEKVKTLEALLASTKNCCKNQSDFVVLMDSYFKTFLKNVMEGKADNSTPISTAFRSWLSSNFVSYKKLSDEIATIASHMHGDYLEFSKAHFERIAKRVAEAIIAESVAALKKDVISMANRTATVTHTHKETLSVADIRKIVKDAILLYDADKTGLVDYALESGGGSVVSTRCSETYNAGTARLSILGFPLWFISNSPRTAIQPDMHPGQCWAFKGSQGFLVLQLSATIRPTGFSLEHIPEALSPAGTIDSAPREVSIWGLSSEKDNDGVLLAEYEYDKKGEPLQYIPVMTTSEGFYSYIELKILSNWGNQRYTCLYRFRVHGSRL